MSRIEKAKARLRAVPTDYTYSEAKQLLRRLGFEEHTSFGATKALADFLMERGDL